MIHTYNDIDWARLRANAMDKKGWKKKDEKDWDKKAQSFSSRTRTHKYVDLFIDHLPLEDSVTVLDVGSGPGTLALPIAEKVQEVTALDFSGAMLDILQSHAKEKSLTNIRTVKCSWEDDWSSKDILPHDIAIASRSLGVADLENALLKLNEFGKQYVFLTDRIGPTPFESGAFKALNRPFKPGPDYIYTLNTLYSLGIHPNVTVLEIDRRVHYTSQETALDSFAWMFSDLTVEETKLLQNYIDTRTIEKNDTGIIVERETPVRWALIWWKKR